MNLSILNLSKFAILIASFAKLGSCEISTSKNNDCKGIDCKKPPGGQSCEIIQESNKDIPRPTGPHMECCSLYKCKRDGSNFYTFHGITGAGAKIDGTETVHYAGDERMGRSADSVGTGGHDATANAGDAQDIADMMKTMEGAGFEM